jgi:hypothetical protein
VHQVTDAGGQEARPDPPCRSAACARWAPGSPGTARPCTRGRGPARTRAPSTASRSGSPLAKTPSTCTCSGPPVRRPWPPASICPHARGFTISPPTPRSRRPRPQRQPADLARLGGTAGRARAARPACSARDRMTPGRQS